ncbi:putative acetyltransferase [Sedimentibacter acidaminivorans]|uniref:Acetyltransferase n=1 Tax=Sedimentibacter acidaminivorans TaxID=913099 RepID=A0ABS4GHL5_9FIRM|nr:putative acetyltransferase [Sedimentibacter acidaminivorans]
MMLPDATVFVYEENNSIPGFIGLIENYIAGIFIDTNSQSKGIGKDLLDYVKKGHSELLLQVYKKNSRAVRFYLREDFVVLNEQTDKNIGEAELVMNWKKRAYLAVWPEVWTSHSVYFATRFFSDN